MCGVVGYVPRAPEADVRERFARLFQESRVRGLHACGLAQPTSQVVRSFTETAILATFDPSRPAIAHARYCTSGDWRTISNNQPIVVDARALAFNGVISMGTKAEFEAAFEVTCAADNDGEVFLRRLASGESADAFIRRIHGSFAGVWLDGDRLYAIRNDRRPLWQCDAYGATWFGSTRDIFARAGFPVPTTVPPYVVVTA
jgi:glutamine phosphoribosylpyrophosphate amidotransferase